MKIKRLSILLLSVLLISMLPTSVYAAARDAYEPIVALSYDISSNDSLYVKQTSKGFVAMNGRTHGQYIVIKDVNFEYEPYAVSISNGVASNYLNNNTYQFRIDSPDNEPFATVYVTECLGWEVPNNLTGTVTVPVTGVHDLYISTNQPNNFYSFYFIGNDPDAILYRPYEGDNIFPDMAGHKYERMTNTLNGLGVVESYEGNNFVPELPLTRMEYAVWLAKFMDDEIPEAAECVFSDITAEDKGYNEVCYLYGSGILSLNSEKTFNPWSFITIRDASVMLLRLLGYENLAIYKGGYPSGYDMLAREVGIAKGFAPTDFLRRGDATKLLYNAIDAEYMDVDGVKNEDVTYTTKTGILESRRGIFKSSGVVSATLYGGLLSGMEVQNGYCIINNERYVTGSTNANDYLGVLCEYYYKETSDGTKNLLYITPDARTKQEIISGNTNKFNTITPTEISYYNENDKKVTLKIPTKAIWIYNNSALPVPISEVVSPNTFKGRIRVVDNGSGWETVLVEEYKNIRFESIDVETQIITDALTGKEIDSAIRKAKIVVSDTQNSVKLSEVPRGSLAELYLSYDKKIAIFIVKEIKISGVAESLNYDGTVRINGVDYKKANELNEPIVLGVTCEFYLNRHNEIVYFTTNDTTKAVASLFDFKEEDGKTVFSLITASNTITEFQAADKIFVDGEKKEDYNEISSALSNVVQYRPVLYRTNADGLLTMIDTHLDNKMNENDTLVIFNESNYTNKYFYYYRSGLGVFTRQSSGYYDHEFPVKSGATIMLQNTTTYGDEDCTVVKLSSYASTTNGEPFVFYSTKRDSNIADILHCVEMPSRSDSGWGVVDSVNSAINDKGEIGLNVSVVVSGSEKSYWVSPDNTDAYTGAQMLKRGDLVVMYLNELKYVHSITVGCFVDGAKSRTLNGVTLSAKVHSSLGAAGQPADANKFVYGTVNAFEEDYVEIVPFNVTRKFWCRIGNSKITRLASDGTITETSGTTIKKDDKIFVRITGSYSTIIVYD